MIKAAVAFFAFGLLAYLLGANNVAGISFEIGRIILTVFAVLAILFVAAAVVIGKRISNS